MLVAIQTVTPETYGDPDALELAGHAVMQGTGSRGEGCLSGDELFAGGGDVVEAGRCAAPEVSGGTGTRKREPHPVLGVGGARLNRRAPRHSQSQGHR